MIKSLNRGLPVPTGASEEVQSTVLATPLPDVTAWKKNFPQNETEWAAVISELDSLEKGFIKGHLNDLPVSIERNEIGGVGVFHVTPADVDPCHEKHLFVHVHGGAHVSGAGGSGLSEALLIADRARIRVLSVDYRMPPEHPFPAGLNDIVAVYQHFLADWSSTSIAFGGSSSGGNLAMAAIHKLKHSDIELPGALFAGTPWTDLSKTGDSYFVNEGLDRSLVAYEGILGSAAHLYAGDQEITNPLISPIYGDFAGFPPTLLVTGTRDLFLSCTVRAHTKLRASGVVADLLVFEGQSHGDYGLLIDSPESQLFYAELGAFLKQYLN